MNVSKSCSVLLAAALVLSVARAALPSAEEVTCFVCHFSVIQLYHTYENATTKDTATIKSAVSDLYNPDAELGSWMKDLDESAPGTCGDLCKKASEDVEAFASENGDALAAAVASGNDQESIEKALCEEQLKVCPADSSSMITSKFKELEQKYGDDQDAAPASPTSRKLLAGLSFNGNVGLSAGLTGTQLSNGQSQAVNMPGSMSDDRLKTLGGILNPWAPRFAAPTPAPKPFGGWFFGGR